MRPITGTHTLVIEDFPKKMEKCECVLSFRDRLKPVRSVTREERAIDDNPHTPAAFFLDFFPCPVGIFTTQANWSVMIALRMSPFEDSII